jgi:fructosamine-3-kinase
LSAGRAGTFLKTATADGLPRLQAEVDGLAALRATATVRVPQARHCAMASGRAVLELEHLDLRPLDRAAGALLGRQLAALHRVTGERFGWPADNFIGVTPQPNGWMESWPRFFAERRLRPQLALARATGLDRATLEQGEALIEKLAAFFVGGHPAPSLLHGDLWGGNAGMLPDGTPVVFDPACYYGDRETDLAMSELFGGFPDSFQAAYREAWPLTEGYETRKTLYNLYHVLNHYNMFGAGYLGQAKRMLARLLADLRG